MPARLSVPRVFITALDIYRHNPQVVLPVAIAVTLVPTAIELVVAHELPDGAASAITTVIDTVGYVVFAGAAEELEHRWELGQRRIKLRGVLAKVPPVILPLLVVGVLQALAIALGLVLFIVPGLVVLAIWSVVGPVTVAERPGIWRAFGRSRRLVRGSFWRVLFVMLLLEVLAYATGAATAGVSDLIGNPPDEPVALAIGEAITLPLEGLALPVMYWRLREIEDARA